MRSNARRRGRGAAYVEAILLIFFMIIIFGGVIYLGNYFEGQQRAQAIARRCAWVFSWNACDNKIPLPSVCEGVIGGTISEPNEELRSGIATAQQNAEGADGTMASSSDPDDAARRENLRTGVQSEMSPFYEMLFGQAFTALGRSKITPPATLPNAEDSIAVSYYLPCNLNHQDPLETAKNLFTSLLGGPL
ncbi:MAG TPA: hypothetical protein VFS67_37395 [Polyangiaceae bacterium]|nr:hypothetical protein [Polyangiaceae bacterium]